MRIGSRTYSTITNVCLITCVGSAIGFDRTSHWTWLVLGGSAAAAGISAYIRRHWQAQPTRPLDESASLRLHEALHGWAEQRPAHVVWPAAWSARHGSLLWHTRPAELPREGFTAARASLELLWQRQRQEVISSLPSMGAKSAKAHPGATRPEPAVLAARLVQELKTGEKGSALDVVISPNGTITLRIRDDTAGTKWDVATRMPDRPSGTVH